MDVTVKLYGTLRRQRPASAEGARHEPFTVRLPDGAGVQDLMKLLNIGEGSVHAVAVNGESVNGDLELHDGDSVNLFPPAAGG